MKLRFNELTKKEKDIIRFFIDNENAPAYQKQIAKGANLSQKYLGYQLPNLVEKKVLNWKLQGVRKRGVTKWYFLREDFKKTWAYCKISSEPTLKEKEDFLSCLKAATDNF